MQERVAVIKSVGIRNTCDLIARIALLGTTFAAALSACSDEPGATPAFDLATTATPSIAETPTPAPVAKRILDPPLVPTATHTSTAALPDTATPTPTLTATATTKSAPTQTPTTSPTPTLPPTSTTPPTPTNTPTSTPTSVPTQTPTSSPTPSSPPTQLPVLIDPELITGGYNFGAETLWREVLSIVPLSEDERSCVLRTFAPDVEGSMDRTFWPESPEEQDVEALGCLATETFANIYLSLIITEYPLTGEHVECLRGLFSVTDFSIIIAAILPEGYDANQVEVEGFWDGFLACVPEELLNEEYVPVLINPELITGGYDFGVETLWREVLSIVPLSEDERSCVLRTFAPDVEGFMDRTFWPELAEEQDVEALGCLAPETFANIYLSLFITVYPLNDEHVECLRGLFSVTDFSVIIAAMLPEGYDANQVEVDGFADGILACVPEEVLNEGPEDPTPTPVPLPEPTPTQTPLASPTSVSIPTPDQSCGLAVPDQAANPGLIRDCNTLLAAQDTLRGTATLNWSVDTPISDWEGVWVQGSPGRVTGLILTSKNLTGTIPRVLGRLDALEHLRLDENRLTGELPAELGSLRDLRSLLLNDNQLTGEVPTSWGNLDNLWRLGLANNEFGCIPSAIHYFYFDTNYQYDLRIPSCDSSDDGPTFQLRQDRYYGHECLDSYDINFVGGATWWMSPLPEIGSGVLEQRVLDNDLVVLAQVLGVNPEVVTVDSVKSRLLDPTDYDGFERTLLIEVHLRVQEYLKGHGPDEITVVVEGQSVFNTEEEGTCAKAAFAHVHGRLIESQEGIALLTQISDPGFYHLGYADAIIAGTHSDHGTWLASDSGKFYDATREEWIGIDEAKQRISSVVEEYGRRDDQRWQNCVYYKHRHKGRDPWAYRGIGWSFEHFRDHDIIFNGERVPVSAGTTIWIYADYHGLINESRLWLKGRDAELFEVAYHAEFERTYNEWDATHGDGYGHHQAIWYILPDGIHEKWQQTVSGYVIKAVEDLPEGEYQFYLFVEDQGDDYVYCGQAHPEPNRFRVFVDADRPTVPHAPTNVEVLDDSEGWTIVWDPEDGVEDYYVYVYRLVEDGEKRRAYVGEDTEDPGYRIRFEELNGCDDLIYVRISPMGDGETYLRDFGVPYDPIELRTEPCAP